MISRSSPGSEQLCFTVVKIPVSQVFRPGKGLLWKKAGHLVAHTCFMKLDEPSAWT